MLVVDIAGMEEVVLGPAVPREWAGGSVRGLRIRGGGSCDFGWDERGVVQGAKCKGVRRRVVNVEGKVLC